MTSRIHVLVHRYSDCTNQQLVRVPKAGKKNPGKALRVFIQSAAKKLRMSKVQAKTAVLHCCSSHTLVSGMTDYTQSSIIVQNLDTLCQGETLLLCSAEESMALVSSTEHSSQIQELPEQVCTLPELPEQMWEIIIEMYCEQQRAKAKAWMQARLRLLRNINGGDHSRVARKTLGGITSESQPQIELEPSNSYDFGVEMPCRQAFILSCLNRQWHRIIGNSSHLDLLGSWFFKIENRWIAYSSKASWDLEIARVLRKKIVTVEVCEPMQDVAGRGRRRHVVIDLESGLQKKAGKGKGRVFEVKRLPADVLARK